MDAARWLPLELPPHVRLVVSVLERPGDEAGAVARAVGRSHARSAHLALERLSPAEGEELLLRSLEEAGRTLTGEQRRAVLDAFETCGLPLWLKLAADRASRWRSFDPVDPLPGEVSALIEAWLEELSRPERHGRFLVERALTLVAATRDGLAEDELLEVAVADEGAWAELEEGTVQALPRGALRRLPFVLWSRLRADMAAYLSEREADGLPLLVFYHRQLAEVVRRRLAAGAGRRAPHEALARYFARTGAPPADEPRYRAVSDGSPAALRCLSELPHQLHRAGRSEELACLLTQFDFVFAGCAAGRTRDLLESYEELAARGEELDAWREFLAESAHLIARGDDDWPAHRIAWQLAWELPEGDPTGSAARRWALRFAHRAPPLARHTPPPPIRSQRPELVVELPEHPEDWAKRRGLERNAVRFERGSRSCVDIEPRVEADGVDVIEPGSLLIHGRGGGGGVVLDWRDGTLRRVSAAGGAKVRALHVVGVLVAVVGEDDRLVLTQAASGMDVALEGRDSEDVGGVLEWTASTFVIWYRDGRIVVRDSRSARILATRRVELELAALLVADPLGLLAGTTAGRVVVLDPELATLQDAELLRATPAGALRHGEWIAVWDEGGGLAVVHAGEPRSTRILAGHPSRIEGVVPGDEDSLLTWSDRGLLRLWKLTDGSHLEHREWGILGDARWSATRVVVRYMADWRTAREVKERRSRGGSAPELADDARERIDYFADLFGVSALRPQSFQRVNGLAPGAVGGIYGVLRMGDERILTWSYGAPVALWEPYGRLVRDFPAIDLPTLERLTVVAAGRFLSLHTDGRVELWDAGAGERVAELEPRHGRVAEVRRVGEDRFATLSGHMSVALWSVADGSCIGVFGGHDSKILGCVQVSEDRLVTWTAEGVARVWSTSRASRKVTDEHGGGMACIVERVSPRTIVSCHQHCTKSWDVATGRLIARLDLIPDNNNQLRRLADDLVAFWCSGFTIWRDVYLWSARSQRPIARFALFDKESLPVDVVASKLERPGWLELTIVCSDERRFAFTFDEAVRPVSPRPRERDGIWVYDRGCCTPVQGDTGKWKRREPWRDHVDQRSSDDPDHVAVGAGAEHARWYSSSPAKLVEVYGDGLASVALEDGSVRVLRVDPALRPGLRIGR